MELILLTIILILLMTNLFVVLLKSNRKQTEQLENLLRQEMKENREELGRNMRELRTELNQSLKLLWLSCGTSDFLYQSSLQLENNLKDRGIRYTTMYPGGGHTWMNCRDYITEVCKLLFQ